MLFQLYINYFRLVLRCYYSPTMPYNNDVLRLEEQGATLRDALSIDTGSPLKPLVFHSLLCVNRPLSVKLLYCILYFFIFIPERMQYMYSGPPICGHPHQRPPLL